MDYDYDFLNVHRCFNRGYFLTKNIFVGLNSEQTKAVTEIEKPLLIIAGAGSGKTLTVASKIAHLVQQGVKVENILALTFNQKAAE